MTQAFQKRYAALAGLIGPCVAIPLSRIAPYWLAWLIGGAAMGLVMQFGWPPEKRTTVRILTVVVFGSVAVALVAALVDQLL